MNAGQVALLVAAAVAVVAVVVLAWVVISMRRTLKVLEAVAADLRRQAVPLVEEARGAVEKASADLVALDRILETTESISTTVDSASKLAYLVFSNPVIKVIALGAGVTRAIGHLRHRGRV